MDIQNIFRKFKMFISNFIFFNFLISINIIFVISNSDEIKTSNLKFDLQFKCGAEPASGRLMFYYSRGAAVSVSAFIFKSPLNFKNCKL